MVAYIVCVTTEIIEEYAEILATFHDPSFAEQVVNFLLKLPQTQLITTYFSWNFIHEDPDDNKFIDCAIAANASPASFSLSMRYSAAGSFICTCGERQEGMPFAFGRGKEGIQLCRKL